MASTLDLLKRLTEHGVDFVLVGGMAATVHGSSLVTEDVDVCTEFSLANVERILAAVRDLDPMIRVPSRPRLSTDPSTYVGWKNLYLVTSLGPLDFLGHILGVGSLADVKRGAVEIELAGFRCKVIGLDDLIRAKRALARPKDLRAAEDLEVVRQKVKGT